MPGAQSFLDLFKGLLPQSPTPTVPYAPGQGPATSAIQAVTPSPQFFTPVQPTPVADRQEKISKTVAPAPTIFQPGTGTNQSLLSQFQDVRKALYPTFDEQVQAVQNENRASFLPEVAKKMALERDKQQNIFRMPVKDPITGKTELTGSILDIPVIGGLERVGSKIIDSIIKAGTEDAAMKILQRTGLPEGNARMFIPDIIAAKTPQEAQSVLGNIGREIKSVNKSASTFDEIIKPQPKATSAPGTTAKEAQTALDTASGGKKPPVPPTAVAPDLPQPRKFEPIEIPRDFTKQIEKTTFNATDAADLSRRLDVLGLGTRTVRTFAEVEQAAQAMGTNVRTLLSISRKGPLSDVEAKALKDTIATANKFITASQVEISRFPERAAQLEPKIADASATIDTALKKLAPGVTEIGRALSALRMQANESLDPAMWFMKAQRMLGPRNLTPEMRGIINNLIDNQDRLGLATYISMLRTASWAEKAATLWKAGLLTAFRTHEANILGNTTMAGLETASNVVSTGFDVLASLFTGKRTITFSAGTIAGKAKGLATGISKAGQFFKTGVYRSDIMSKYEVKSVNFNVDLPLNAVFRPLRIGANKILDGYTKAVFRSLGAEDIVFREAAMQEALVTQAEVIAKNAGLKGQEYKAKVQELLQKPTNEMVLNSINAAEYQTFQQDSKVAELLTTAKVTLQNMDSPIAKWGGIVLEFIAPFAKTPINIAKAIADYSPLGFVKAILKAVPAQTRSQQEFVKDIGRAVTGTGFITLGAYLAQNGLMTGNPPTEKNARDQFYAEGKQPNSLLVGPYWFKLSRISPMGNLLSLGAEFHEQGQTTEGTALLAGTAFGGAKTLTDMTFLQGVSSLLNAIQDPEAYAGKYVQSSVASLVPTIVNHVARAIDPRLRVPDGVFQALEARTPFLSKDVPVRRDIFGNPVKAPGGATALFNPFEPSLAVNNPIIEEAKNIHITIGLPDQTISGIKLSNQEFSTYQKVQGKILEQTLSTLIQSDGYKALSVTEKEKEFKNTITNVRQAVNDQIFPALMIGRYGLPTDTNPRLLRIVLSELSKVDKFKKMPLDKQSTALKKLLQAGGTTRQ